MLIRNNLEKMDPFEIVRTYNTRGIWKVLCMVFYLCNLFTNPIMFGNILQNYLSSMLWYKFLEDSIMQTQIILL